MKRANPSRRGFTLVEILIVVVLLGILASTVIGMFNANSDEARRNAFISNIRSFAQAAQVYVEMTGTYLEDSSSGVCPRGFERFIRTEEFERITPVGGVWDSQYNEDGITSAVGVHFNGQGQSRDDTYMTELDSLFDDGTLTGGAFRKLANGRFYFVIAE